jgi:hypothetical protein
MATALPVRPPPPREPKRKLVAGGEVVLTAIEEGA